MIAVVFLVTIICFLLIHLIPGDPVRNILGIRYTQEQYDLVSHELGLDKPIPVQYINWVGGVLHGDFGKSLLYAEDVADLINEKLPITLYLTFVSIFLSSIAGIVLGIICATKRGSAWDYLISLFANNSVAIPSFFLAILGIYLFGLKLGWLPVQGWTSPFVDFWQHAKQSVMPIIALSIPNMAIVARQTRSSMLETIKLDYIRTLASKGLSRNAVIYKHALRNALIPVVTVIGLALAIMIGGEVLIETIFGIPGIGRLLVRAALENDYPIVQSVVFILAVVVCLTNLLVDITYGWIDPRIRSR